MASEFESPGGNILKTALEKQPVLVLGVEPRISVPIARSLHRHHIPVMVAALSAQEPRISSRAITHFVRLPSYCETPDHFVDALSSLIHESNVDMLIPATDAALSAISSHYNHLSELTHVACPPPLVVDRVLNKQTTLEIAQRCGIRVPREYLISEAANLEEIADSLSFPVVAKPRSKGSQELFKVRYFHSREKLGDAVQSGELSGAILQEYCPGAGIGIEILIHRGKQIAAFQHRRLKENPHTGGVAVLALSEPLNQELVEKAHDLLREIEWDGAAMVEFRWNPADGQAALMEINGRYWGTLSLPIQAGIDFPFYQWQLAHDETPQVPSSYVVGMRWRWDAGYIRRVRGILPASLKLNASSLRRDLMSSAMDFLPPVRDALWSLADPWPAIWEAGRAVKNVFASDAASVAKRLLPARLRDPFRSYSKPEEHEGSVGIASKKEK